MDTKMTKNQLSEAIELKLARFYGVQPADANEEQMYKAVIMTVRDILTQKRSAFRDKVKKQRAKRVYYMCMEFLIGRSLKNNIRNLDLEPVYAEVLKDFGYDIENLYEKEPDAALGNGGTNSDLFRVPFTVSDQLHGDSCIKDFYKLSGPVPLLPRYTLGNWWSRYHDYSDKEYYKLLDDFKAKDVPFSVAVIDMDWHITKTPDPVKYGSGWTGYTWNRDLFHDREAESGFIHHKPHQIGYRQSGNDRQYVDGVEKSVIQNDDILNDGGSGKGG